MEGFGIHTFRFVNSDGVSTFVKFHWKPKLGMQSFVWDESLKIQAADNDYQRRDLYESIESGNYPEFELGVQVFGQAFADAFPFDVLDPTKLIPEELLPIRKIGRMVLNRNPDNFFAETEQVAFCPSNIVPGIDFTEDPLLQGRLFSYLDTQLKRLGSTNFHQIPINAPKCPFMNFQRDGHMQTMMFKGRANYEPNSLAENGEIGGPRECPKTGFGTCPVVQTGEKVRLRAETFADHYSQARLFWKSQTPIEQAHIASAFTFELSKVVLEPIRERMISNLGNVDPELAQRVANGIGMSCPKPSTPAKTPIDLDPSAALSIHRNMKPSIEGRTFGILIAEGSDAKIFKQVKKSIEDGKGTVKVVAMKVGGVKMSDGSTVKADGQLLGSPSVIFDGIFVCLSDKGTQELIDEAAAVQWVMDAFGHLKAIGHTPESKPLLDKAGVEVDKGIVMADRFVAAAAMRYYDRENKVRTMA